GVVDRVQVTVELARAHGDHERVVGRVVQLGGAHAGVAGRGDDHDALAPGALGGVGEGIDDVLLDAVGAEREVQHADVHAVVVAVLDHPVDAGNDLRHVGDAVAAGGLDVNDARVGRDAIEVVRIQVGVT